MKKLSNEELVKSVLHRDLIIYKNEVELLRRLSEGQRAIELIQAIREERGFHKHNFLDVLDAMIGEWEGGK